MRRAAASKNKSDETSGGATISQVGQKLTRQQTIFWVVAIVPWTCHVATKYGRLSSRGAERIGQAKKMKGVVGCCGNIGFHFLFLFLFFLFLLIVSLIFRASSEAQTIQKEVTNDRIQ
jgi:hypothetical protein